MSKARTRIFKQQHRIKKLNKRIDQQIVADVALTPDQGGHGTSLEINKKGTGKHFNHQSQFALAMRRNFTNVACADIGAVLLQDLNRYSVARAEVHTGAVLLMSSHKFNRDSAECPAVIRAFEYDATNSDIWQRRSLSACRLETLKIRTWLEDESQDLREVSLHQKRWCDLLPVEGKSSAATYALIGKHLASAGVSRLWRDPHSEPTHEGTPTVTVWCNTTDRGPDCVGARTMCETESGPYDLFFGNDCGKHAGHIIQKGVLVLADQILKKNSKEYKYYVTLCKLIHLWRDDAAKVHNAFVELFGAEEGNKWAKHLPPTCVAARWGSVECIEIRLDDAGVEKVVKVILHVLKVDADKKKKKKSNKNTLDDISLEETQFYSDKMGRWKRDVANSIVDQLWQKMVTASRMLRETTSHFMSSLSVVYTEDELDEYGGALARLIDGKAEECAREYSRSMTHPKWGILCIDVPDADAEELRSYCAQAILRQASAFDWRILAKLQRRPLVLLRMAKEKPSTCSEGRRRIATELMAADEGTLDPTSLKVKRLFSEDLSMAVSDGTLGLKLYTILRGARRVFKQDVQENEHVNSIIKILCKRSPNLTLALLSARIGLKGWFGKALAQNKPGKVAACKAMGKVMMETLMECREGCGRQNCAKLLAIKDRWSAPKNLPPVPKVDLSTLPLQDGLADAQEEAKALIEEKQWMVGPLVDGGDGGEGLVIKCPHEQKMKWAHVFTLAWIREVKEMLELAVPLVIDAPCGPLVFAERHRFQVRVAKANWDNEEQCFVTVLPLQLLWLDDAILECFDQVKSSAKGLLMRTYVVRYHCGDERSLTHSAVEAGPPRVMPIKLNKLGTKKTNSTRCKSRSEKRQKT